MKSFIAVLDVTGSNNIAKCLDFDLLAEADAFVLSVSGNYPNSFSASSPSTVDEFVTADVVLKTITEDTAGRDAAQLTSALGVVTANIKLVMYARLKQGFKWKYNNVGPEYAISIDPEMEGFLTRLNLKFDAGRTNPHNGYIRSKGVKFNVDDAGANEICLFAGCWGDEISRICIDKQETALSMTLAQLQAYDSGAIDWTIDWSVDPQNNGNGWTDDTVLQIPGV